MVIRTDLIQAQEYVIEASRRIYDHVRRTPLDFSPYYSDASDCNVYLKLENLQLTGSFKLRGVVNKILSMDREALTRGCVVASTGNHGAAAAYAFSRLDTGGIIFVPENANPAKLDNIRQWGGEIQMHGTDGAETETHARDYAAQNGMTYISPYNDAHVIGGQGTVGHEIEKQLKNVDVVLAAVGGGGLLSGIAACLKDSLPNVEVVACLPENSPVMARSMESGRVINMECAPTLSDGTAGGMEENSLTLPLCQHYVDATELVSEEEIAAAMRRFIGHQHMLIEGAAGVAMAAFEKRKKYYQGRNVVIVICGGNIDLASLEKILCGK